MVIVASGVPLGVPVGVPDGVPVEEPIGGIVTELELEEPSLGTYLIPDSGHLESVTTQVDVH